MYCPLIRRPWVFPSPHVLLCHFCPQSVCTATGFGTPALTWTDQMTRMFTLSPPSTVAGTTTSGNTTDIDGEIHLLESVLPK